MKKSNRIKIAIFIFFGVSVIFILALLGQAQIQQKKINKKNAIDEVNFPVVKLSITQSPASPTVNDKIRFIVDTREPGDIHKVVFYIDSQKVGEDTTCPWTFDGGPFAVGTFIFCTRAYHLSGKEICCRNTSVQVK